MPITHFNFQFEKEGARRIALAEQPRPTKECTRYDVAHTRFSLFYVITIRPVDGKNRGRQENRWRVCNLSTFPVPLDSLQSRPKKRARERAIRASYGRFETPFCPADIFPREGQEAGAEKGLLVLVEPKQRDCPVGSLI